MSLLVVRILIAGALCFGLLAAGAWAYGHHAKGLRAEGFTQGAAQVQGQWSAEKLERARVAALDLAVQTTLATERQAVAMKAAHEARKRETDLRAAAERARDVSERLSGELAATRTALATAPVDAIRLYAATANAVFDDCQRAYRGLAQEADGHASDSLMFQQAWPQ